MKEEEFDFLVVVGRDWRDRKEEEREGRRNRGVFVVAVLC
jgi:hypothetical protein